MDDGQEIQDLLDIQGGTMAWVTKGELLEEQRRRGAGISTRQLTNYITQGLIPRSVRVGSRAGAYPAIAVDLVFTITRARRAGLSPESIKKIIPLWKFLTRARRNKRVDLEDFEYLARRHITSLEAAYAVPWLFRFALPSPIVEPDEAAQLEVKYKDGTTRRHSPDEPLEVEFILAEQDPETHEVRRRSSLRITFPVVEDDKSVILGIPNGVELPPCAADRQPGAPDPGTLDPGTPEPALRSRITRPGKPARRSGSRAAVKLVRTTPNDDLRPAPASPSTRSRSAPTS